MTGKWHLGQQNGTPPWERGFMRSLNSRFGEIYFPKENDKPGTKKLYLNGRELPKDSPEIGADWYSTDLFTEWGLKFIDEARAAKKPFFLYIAQGAAHFPLRAPAEVIAKYRGKYMAGWDVLREQRYAKQKQLGLIDPAWPLAPRPPEVAAWDSLTAEQKDRFDQMMAVYAAMIDRIDHAMGTLVAGLRERGELDNTLILFLHDNGGNAEGGPDGISQGNGSDRWSGEFGSPRDELGDSEQHAVLPLQAFHPRRRHQHPLDRALACGHPGLAARRVGISARSSHRCDGDMRRSGGRDLSQRVQGSPDRAAPRSEPSARV